MLVRQLNLATATTAGNPKCLLAWPLPTRRIFDCGSGPIRRVAAEALTWPKIGRGCGVSCIAPARSRLQSAALNKHAVLVFDVDGIPRSSGIPKAHTPNE